MTFDAAEFENFYAIIPAGGSGVRLWPLSRRGAPKFLMNAPGEDISLLQSTVSRLRKVVPIQRILVVTGVAHVQAVREQLPDLPPENLIAEPSPRDSMAAIGLATALVAGRNPAAIVGSFASDHVIEKVPEFLDAIAAAVRVAMQDFVVTIGIEPERPATGFGYIRAGEPIAESDGAYLVSSFVEKPDAETAAGYLATGDYKWNAGMFVSRAAVLMHHLAGQQSGLAKGIGKIANQWGSADHDEVLNRVWPSLTRISIDHAIAEPLAARGGVAVIPAEFGWDDIGDYQALLRLAVSRGVAGSDNGPVEPDSKASTPVSTPGAPGDPEIELPDAADVSAAQHSMVRLGQGGTLVDVDSTGVAVLGTQRLVATLGISGLAIVDTPDVLLVAALERAQDLKSLVAALEKQVGTKYL